jgi:hypothetical protein
VKAKIQPGPALAAGVLVAALLALALMGRGGVDGLSPLPPPGAGSTVPLLPGGPGAGADHDAGVAQYGKHGRHPRLIARSHRHR